MTTLMPKDTVTPRIVIDEMMIHVNREFPPFEGKIGRVNTHRRGDGLGIYIKATLTWGVTGSLDVRFVPDIRESHQLPSPAIPYRVKCEVSWSSSLNIIDATASLALYQKLVNLGALLESIAANFPPVVEWEGNT